MNIHIKTLQQLRIVNKMCHILRVMLRKRKMKWNVHSIGTCIFIFFSTGVPMKIQIFTISEDEDDMSIRNVRRGKVNDGALLTRRIESTLNFRFVVFRNYWIKSSFFWGGGILRRVDWSVCYRLFGTTCRLCLQDEALREMSSLRNKQSTCTVWYWRGKQQVVPKRL